MAADIYLYNKSGEAVLYQGADTLETDTPTAGQHAIFTHGEVEEKTIEPDFSSGDMAVSAASGKLWRGVTVEKPDGLAPENIRAGIEIAGVTGTFSGGNIARNMNAKQDYFADASKVTADMLSNSVSVTIPTDAEVLEVYAWICHFVGWKLQSSGGWLLDDPNRTVQSPTVSSAATEGGVEYTASFDGAEYQSYKLMTNPAINYGGLAGSAIYLEVIYRIP